MNDAPNNALNDARKQGGAAGERGGAAGERGGTAGDRGDAPGSSRALPDPLQALYEKHPYPPPAENLDQWLASQLFLIGCPSRFFHWYWPARAPNSAMRILIAGCGSQQAAQFALNLPEAKITAIDISRASLTNTRRLLERHAVGNVDLREMAIEEAGGLGGPFDLIISTGVLHHLADPARGLAVLTGLLDREGSLYLMLYGKYGRDGVRLLQALFRRLGLDAQNAQPEDFAEIRRLVAGLDPTHPMGAKRALFGDWMSDAGAADLLLNPRERSYALPEIGALLEGCGLQMQKLIFRAHYAPRCTRLIASPFYERIRQAPLPEQWAVGELYRAAIKAHFFVACHKGRPAHTLALEPGAPGWREQIPLLNPFLTLTDAPPGQAPTLHWSKHGFDEIALHLNPSLAALLREVDGQRSVAVIQARAKIHGSAEAVAAHVTEIFAALLDFDFIWFRRPHAT